MASTFWSAMYRWSSLAKEELLAIALAIFVCIFAGHINDHWTTEQKERIAGSREYPKRLEMAKKPVG